MSQTMRGPAGMPLRTLLAAFVLAGLGWWQAWQCADGMMALPMAAATMTVTMADPGHDADAAATADPGIEPGMPGGMTGLCITVLASLAAALVLSRSPLKLLALLRRLTSLLMTPAELPARKMKLAQLCVSRT